MRKAGWALLSAMMIAAPAVARVEAPAQAALDTLAESLGYRFEVVDNQPTCPDRKSVV